MENILFKISFPAEFHAQTAVEVAITLHEQIKVHGKSLNDIQSIQIETQESGDRIINKIGALDNPADRDHCIQYMIAVPLIKGSLSAEDYEDDIASDPRIDQLRDKMTVAVNERFTREYLESDKRAIGNAIEIIFSDGSSIKESIDYPIGHRRRREEGIPLLKEKFERYLRGKLNQKKADHILQICGTQETFEQTPVNDMMNMFVVNQ